MKTDVVVTMCNPSEKAVECLKSLSWTRDGVNRIIILDNASSEDRYVVESAVYADMVVRLRRQIPLAALWNLGLHIGETDGVVLSNDDIMFAPGWLRPLQDAMAQDSLIGVVQPFNTLSAMPENFPHNYRRVDEVGPIPSTNFIGCCFMVVKDVLEVIKDFDREHFPDYADYTYFWGPYPFGVEDQDFYRRVRLCGYKTCTAFQAYVHHWTGETMKRFEQFEAIKARAEQLYIERWQHVPIKTPV